jgi:hypothetical protein
MHITLRLTTSIYFYIFYFLIVVLGLECGIHRSSYNISNLSFLISPLPLFPVITLLPFHEYLQQVSFSINIHVYSVFASYSPSCILSLPPPLSHCTKHPDRTFSFLLFSDFVKKKRDSFSMD